MSCPLPQKKFCNNMAFMMLEITAPINNFLDMRGISVGPLVARIIAQL